MRSHPCDQSASMLITSLQSKSVHAVTSLRPNCIHAGHVPATKRAFIPGSLCATQSYSYLVTSLRLNRVYPCAVNRVSIFNEREQGVRMPESALLWTFICYVHKDRPPSLIISCKDRVTSSFLETDFVVAAPPYLPLPSHSWPKKQTLLQMKPS
jgi:hypothetical protein